ncbi:mitotic fidelity of chromosome transmission- protein [Coemansia sp. RSA 552]|nr:mitotic fidelity of chromosome transmission- protein [Coemansia sp. RSA 552]
MSSRTPRRAKSPAQRNRYNNIGVTGRHVMKTGVRVAGNVRVDEDGLENVDEFYKQTTPPEKEAKSQKKRPKAQTLHTIVSPTPVRSKAGYSTLVGALEMPNRDEAEHQGASDTWEDVEDELTATPSRRRGQHLEQKQLVSTPAAKDSNVAATPTIKNGTRTAANRRTTMAPERVAAEAQESWMRSPRKNRRATMAATAIQPARSEVAELTEEPGALETLEALEEEAVEDPGELTSATAIEGSDEVAEADAHDDIGNEDDMHFAIEEAEDEHLDSFAAEEAEAPEDANNDSDAEGAESDVPRPESPIAEDMPASEDEVDSSSDIEEEVEQQPKRAPKKPAPRRKKATPEQPVRRSARASVHPVAYWRNEHIEYEYTKGGEQGALVPQVKNVVRVRQTAEEKNRAKKRRLRQGTQQLPSLRGIKNELDPDNRNRFFYYDDENYGFPVVGDTAGKYGPRYVDSDKRAKGKRALELFEDDDDIDVDSEPRVVKGPDGKSTRQQEIAISREGIQWATYEGTDKGYKPGMGLVCEYSPGITQANSYILTLAVGAEKPPRNSNLMSLFFMVTSGQVEVTVHKSKFKVGILGQFLVPNHNSYMIKNVGTHPAQLHCVSVNSADAVIAAATAAESSADDASDSE